MNLNERIAKHIVALPPHAQDRLSSRLLADALDRILELEEALEPLSETHPEDRCEDCGLQNVTWSAPNVLWNAVCRLEGAERDPMLCPRCFVLRAERVGIEGPWVLGRSIDHGL